MLVSTLKGPGGGGVSFVLTPQSQKQSKGAESDKDLKK
jgi:hypothetical protein